jgi:glycosyltransferase involved in cell wall biosynthesis
MRKIYSKARVILVPSRWNEGWGRVASEAHVNGIPVVAARRAGLPEAVGPGGILIEPDAPVEEWSNAINRLWTDECCYASLSAAALEYSRRPALNADAQIEALLGVLRAACAA